MLYCLSLHIHVHISFSFILRVCLLVTRYLSVNAVSLHEVMIYLLFIIAGHVTILSDDLSLNAMERKVKKIFFDPLSVVFEQFCCCVETGWL